MELLKKALTYAIYPVIFGGSMLLQVEFLLL